MACIIRAARRFRAVRGAADVLLGAAAPPAGLGTRWDMTQPSNPEHEIAVLRERLSRLSEASLRINESLEFDTVLQEVLDSARALCDARYGVITLFEESGEVSAFLSSGMTREEAGDMWALSEGVQFAEHLRGLSMPLRTADFAGYVRSIDLNALSPLTDMGAFLAAPVRHRGRTVGAISLAKNAPDPAFSREDEETLVTFGSQAALVIVNAGRYRDEQRARSDLETVVNTAPVGVVVFDARTGEVVSVNREAQRIVSVLREPGQETEELMRLVTVRRADGREVSLKEFTVPELLRPAETIRGEEIVIRVPHGRSITTLVNATPIHSGEGELLSFVVALQDLTPLEELDRLRTEFLGMVSHELQIPLTSIKGSTSTLLDEDSDLGPTEQRQFLRIIEDQAEHMRGLMSDLLDVARIETGTLSVVPAPVEVTRLVDEAKNRFLGNGGRNELRIELAMGLPLVMADGRRIVQVIGNLLSNAARYSPELSPIGVIAERDGVHVAISVVDEGAGLPPEHVPQLFGKYSRLDNQEHRGSLAGSGLGLAICKGIVEAHGGRIRADSPGPGMGSRFTFHPALGRRRPRRRHSASPRPPPGTSRAGAHPRRRRRPAGVALRARGPLEGGACAHRGRRRGFGSPARGGGGARSRAARSHAAGHRRNRAHAAHLRPRGCAGHLCLRVRTG